MHDTLPRPLHVPRAVDVESSSGREPASFVRECDNAVNCRTVTGCGMLGRHSTSSDPYINPR